MSAMSPLQYDITWCTFDRSSDPCTVNYFCDNIFRVQRLNPAKISQILDNETSNVH